MQVRLERDELHALPSRQLRQGLAEHQRLEMLGLLMRREGGVVGEQLAEEEYRIPDQAALQCDQGNTERSRSGQHSLVERRQLDSLATIAQKLERRQMQRVECAHRNRKRLQRLRENRWGQLDQCHATDQNSRFLPVRASKAAGVNPVPHLVFE